mgnify:CR=1 FL=1
MFFGFAYPDEGGPIQCYVSEDGESYEGRALPDGVATKLGEDDYEVFPIAKFGALVCGRDSTAPWMAFSADLENWTLSKPDPFAEHLEGGADFVGASYAPWFNGGEGLVVVYWKDPDSTNSWWLVSQDGRTWTPHLHGNDAGREALDITARPDGDTAVFATAVNYEWIFEHEVAFDGTSVSVSTKQAVSGLSLNYGGYVDWYNDGGYYIVSGRQGY